MSLPDLIDTYYLAREQRLAADREAARLDKIEKDLKQRLLDIILTEGFTASGGKLAVVKLNKKEKPAAEDWNKIHSYIQVTGEFDLLHKRLTEAACQARWDDGLQIPGVSKFIVYDLTLSKPNL